MKTIKFKDREFQYRVCCSSSEYGDYYWTEFYDGNEEVIKKKWGLFGPKIHTTRPKYVFRINEDANCVRKSKKWWNKRISEEIDLLNRKEEIERGELI